VKILPQINASKKRRKHVLFLLPEHLMFNLRTEEESTSTDQAPQGYSCGGGGR